MHRLIVIYILLTKREGRTGRISARGLDTTDLATLGPYKKDRGPIFSQYSPEKAWLIRDLLHDWRKQRHKCGIIRDNARSDTWEYRTGNRAFWLVDFSHWPSDCLSRVIKIVIKGGLLDKPEKGFWDFLLIIVTTMMNEILQ